MLAVSQRDDYVMRWHDFGRARRGLDLKTFQFSLEGGMALGAISAGSRSVRTATDRISALPRDHRLIEEE